MLLVTSTMSGGTLTDNNYMKYHGAKVYYYLCKGNQESKNLESQMISSFYDKFGAMPVGNGARSFQCETKEDEQ